jgi:hypothetical protein
MGEKLDSQETASVMELLQDGDDHQPSLDRHSRRKGSIYP